MYNHWLIIIKPWTRYIPLPGSLYHLEKGSVTSWVHLAMSVCLRIRALVIQFWRYWSENLRTLFSLQEGAHLSKPSISDHYSIKLPYQLFYLWIVFLLQCNQNKQFFLFLYMGSKSLFLFQTALLWVTGRWWVNSSIWWYNWTLKDRRNEIMVLHR